MACLPRATEGQACGRPGTSSGSVVECDPSTLCVPILPTDISGTCTKPGAVGDVCDTTHPCGGVAQCMGARCVVFDPASCPIGLLVDAGSD
jgi:hypothetical protein